MGEKVKIKIHAIAIALSLSYLFPPTAQKSAIDTITDARIDDTVKPHTPEYKNKIMDKIKALSSLFVLSLSTNDKNKTITNEFGVQGEIIYRLYVDSRENNL